MYLDYYCIFQIKDFVNILKYHYHLYYPLKKLYLFFNFYGLFEIHVAKIAKTIFFLNCICCLYIKSIPDQNICRKGSNSEKKEIHFVQ